MAKRKPTENDQSSLPFGALQMLAPPVRLVSAALWKVMKQRDVMQYGIVEEFVTSACETVPGLLTFRHQAKLALGLRARLIFELCREHPDPKAIAEHMKRIRVPVLPSSSSFKVERDYKIQSAVENTHATVPKLLTDVAERERFFKEEFPLAYGTNYDQELEKLLWEFLIRLDQLLPVPSLAQTVSWLSDAPPVLEECARAASQPQLLKVLLKHQTCLGHLDPAASLPPSMGDGIITSLSLPLSGKAPSNVSTGLTSTLKTPFIKPVIGLISIGMKRKDTDDYDTASDEEDVQRKSKHMKKRTARNIGQINKNCDAKDLPVDNREMLQTCLHNMGYNMHPIPNDDFLCSMWVSCLKHQPRVIIEKLPLNSACDTNLPMRRTDAPIKAVVCNSAITHRTTASFSSSDNKENTPKRLRTRRSAITLQSNAEHQDSPAEMEDYVADSEDEATKNFKVRLFTKRYCKTKHGTYVPTLREYWKPCAERRNLLGPGSKHR